MKDKDWMGPREKIRQKGVTSLTTIELLQVAIGSGNSYMGVAKIARKTLKVLSKEGASVTYDQLSSVPGLGPAKVCQILALFEIASRYPAATGRFLLDTTEKGIEALSDVRLATSETIIVILLDGAYRLVGSHLFLVGNKHPTDILRQIFVSILKDRAEKIIVGMGSSERSLEPSIFDLTFARDMRSMSRLCRVAVKDFIILNKTDEMRLSVER